MGFEFQSFGANSHVFFTIVPQSKPYPYEAPFCQGPEREKKGINTEAFIYLFFDSESKMTDEQNHDVT